MRTKLLAWLLLSGVMLLADGRQYMFGLETTYQPTTKFLNFQYITPESELFASGAVLHGWLYNRKGGAAYSGGNNGSLPADTLLEHGIWCKKAKLLLPSQGANVTVRIWVGDWFLSWRRLYGEKKISLTVNGSSVISETLTPETSFAHWNKGEAYVFSRHDPIWDRIVKPVLEEFTVTVPVVQGRIEFDMENILLTALAVTETPAEMTKLAAEVETARRQEFAARYPWRQPQEEPMPAVDANTTQRGFVLFQKYGDDVVTPWSRPAEEDMTDTIRVFAARGEQEIFRFGILPLRDIPELSIAIGDFQGPAGTLMTAENGDVWRERYKETGSQGTRGKIDDIWRLDPRSYVLQKMSPQPGEAGTPRLYVLDFHVPAEAAPGDYFAPLQVLSSGKVIGAGRLQLKVLPFALRYDGAASYNFQMGYGLWADFLGGYESEEIKKKYLDRIRFISKYHFHNNFYVPWGYAFPSIWRLGTITGEVGERTFRQTLAQAANLDWWMRNLKECGNADYIMLKGHYLMLNLGWTSGHIYSRQRNEAGIQFTPEETALIRQDMVRIVRQINDIFLQKHYPTPYWYWTGELDNRGVVGIEDGVEIAKVLREAGAISLVTINGPLAYKATPPVYDHVWANAATPIDENLLAQVRKHGHSFGAHNTGDTRFQAGYQFWRMDAEAKHQETVFYTDFLLPYVFLPWNYNTALAYPASDGSLVPSLPFYNYRDGRDDYLYLYTLEQAMQKAEKGPALEAARAFVANLRRKIHLDPRKYHKAVFDGIEGTAGINDDAWNATSFERYRWKIAQLIMKLEAAE